MAGTPPERPAGKRPARRKPAATARPEVPYELPEGADTFGARVDSLALPGEDPAELKAELNRWYAFYRARSIIAISCIGWAFHAWVELGRARRCEATFRKKAIHLGQEEWDDAQFEVVEKYRQLMPHAPAQAVDGLTAFAAGCRFLINRWQRLKGLLEKDGTWCPRDRDEAIRLLGDEPAMDHLRDSPRSYLTWLCWLLTQPRRNEPELAALTDPSRTPPALREQTASGRFPSPSGCRDWLRELIDQVLQALRQREEALWVKIEEPGRSQSVARELEAIEAQLKTAARCRRYSEESLRRNLKMAAEESKRAGYPLPRGAVPYRDV
jgi:hypothetical protein